MKQTDFDRLLLDAHAKNVGVGAFNVILLEHAEAIVAGAENAGLPVILQISENCVNYHGSLRPIVVACVEIARRAKVEVLVHLDHVKDVALIVDAIDAGADSVMYDGSHLPYEENAATTRHVVELCHARGVAVEAELGEVGGKDGVHAPGARTSVEEAVAFVAATGVDALAVAVGNSHAMNDRVIVVDHALIGRLASGISVPLVLHGSSGLDDAQLALAVRNGMTKINISTHLNGLFTRAAREILAGDVTLVDPRKYVAAGKFAVAVEVERLLRVISL